MIVLPRETCCHNDLIEHVTCGDLKKFPKLWCSGPTTKQFVITYGFIPTNPGRDLAKSSDWLTEQGLQKVCETYVIMFIVSL